MISLIEGLLIRKLWKNFQSIEWELQDNRFGADIISKNYSRIARDVVENHTKYRIIKNI